MPNGSLYDHHITMHHLRFWPSSPPAVTLAPPVDAIASELRVSKTSLDVVAFGEANSPCATSRDVRFSFGLGVNQPPGKNFEDDVEDDDGSRRACSEGVSDSHFGRTQRYVTRVRRPNRTNLSLLAKSSAPVTSYAGRGCSALDSAAPSRTSLNWRCWRKY